MQTGQTRWTAFASVTAAVAAIGCGDLAPGTTAPGPTTARSKPERRRSPPCPRARSIRTRASSFRRPPPGAVQQVVDLVKGRKLLDAARIAAMEATPRAVWFTGGTPAEVKAAVAQDGGRRGAAAHRPGARRLRRPVPRLRAVLGGRSGRHRRVRGLDRRLRRPASAPPRWSSSSSPTGWASSRTTTTSGGRRSGASPPAPAPPRTNATTQINYAVDSIHAKAPSAAVYLDGTHSAWLGANEAAYRLAARRRRARRGVLPERLELPADADSAQVRHLGLVVPRR